MSISSIIGISLIILASSLVSCSESNTATLSTQYIYDSKLRLKQKIDPDGDKTRYKYNDDDLPTKIEYPDDVVKYGYYENGNRKWMENKAGRTEYKYDAFDRLSEVILNYSPERKIKYGYDPWSRISDIQIIQNDQKTYHVKYDYNILGNLRSIDDGSGLIQYDYYQDKGEIVRHLPNGIKTVYSYSPFGELKSLKHSDSQNKLIASYSYEYDPPGKISRVIENTPEGIKTTKYEWDNRGYLETLHLPDGNSIRYEYNAMGNRISMTDNKGTTTYKYDNFGRLLKMGDSEYEWNKSGYLVVKREGKKSITRIKYDGRGLPALISTPHEAIRYQWDGDGNMISSSKKKEITHYLPNPLAPSGFPLAEYDKTGKLTNSYLYSNGLVGQRNRSGRISYFLEDGLNSIRYVAESHGKIIGQVDHSPYGVPKKIQTGDDLVPDFAGLFGDTLNFVDRNGAEAVPVDSHSVWWDAFGDSLSKWRLPTYSVDRKGVHATFPPPLDMPQRFDDGTAVKRDGTMMQPGEAKRFFVNTVRSYELAELQENYEGKDISKLSQQDQAKVRNIAFNKFANNYSDYPGHRIDINGPYFNDFNQFVANMNILTEDGWTSVDWTTTVQDSKRTFWFSPAFQMLTTGQRLKFGKVMHNIVSPRIGQKEFPEGSVFEIPQSNLNAVSLIKRFGSMSVARAISVPGVSVVTSSRPLTTAEYTAWKNSRSQNNPTSSNTQRAPWNQFYSDGGSWGGGGGPGGGPWGPGGGGGSGSDAGFNDQFKSVEANLGGIKLDSDVEFTGDLGNITGVVYDPERDVLVFLGEDNADMPSINASDLAVAINLDANGARFSLDPYDPLNPNGPPFRRGDVLVVFNGKRISDITSLAEELLRLPKKPCESKPLENFISVRVLRDDNNVKKLRVCTENYSGYDKPEDVVKYMLGIITETNNKGQLTVRGVIPWLKAVYMPENVLLGTSFGASLFEADWLLKQYSMGARINENGERSGYYLFDRPEYDRAISECLGLRLKECNGEIRVSGDQNWLCASRDDIEYGKPYIEWSNYAMEAMNYTIPELEDAVLSFDSNAEMSKSNRNRFWISSDKMVVKKYGKTIYFDKATMRVDTEKQKVDPNNPKGLSDVGYKDPDSERFATLFTQNYDRISEDEGASVLGRVKQLAKTVAIAQWIKQENIPYNLKWVAEYANEEVKNTKLTNELNLLWYQLDKTARGCSGLSRRVSGGVNLKVEPKYVADNGQVKKIEESVISRIKEGAGPVFTVNHEGKKLKAIVVPLTDQGKSMWKEPSVKVVDGVNYKFNKVGDVERSTDQLGNRSEFTYDDNRKLKTIKIETVEGWTAFANRDNQGTTWTFTNRRQNKLRYKYDKSGRLREVLLDGNKLASYAYDIGKKTVSINYPAHEETIAYNNNGYVSEYTFKNKADAKEERIFFEYNSSNNIADITGTDIGKIHISYSKDGSRPVAIKTSQAEVNYDSDHRIKNINLFDGPSINYFYEGEKLNKIKIKSVSKEAEYLFDEGHLVETHNFFGGTTEYKYTDEGMLNTIIDPRKAKLKYVYDEKSRLSKVKLPDGRWIEYKYRERSTKGKESSSPVQTLTVITHASSKYVKDISSRQKSATILRSRLDDIKEASRDLKNGLIIDLFVERKGTVHTNIVDATGNTHKVDVETAKEFRRLLKYTSKTKGKLGRTLLRRWQEFYDTNLSDLNTAILWKAPDGKTVKLKPVLIIKSNEVNYKYANLEKVPVLTDNFTIFIASKTKEAKNVSETSAKELVSKINNIPKINRENIVFVIRLPDMSKSEQERWQNEIGKLREVIGEWHLVKD